MHSLDSRPHCLLMISHYTLTHENNIGHIGQLVQSTNLFGKKHLGQNLVTGQRSLNAHFSRGTKCTSLRQRGKKTAVVCWGEKKKKDTDPSIES